MSKSVYILTVEDYGNFDPESIDCAASHDKLLMERLRDVLNGFFYSLPAEQKDDILVSIFLDEPEYRAKLLEAVSQVITSSEDAEEFVQKLCDICSSNCVFVYDDNFRINEVIAL